jgi:hypothetical protein
MREDRVDGLKPLVRFYLIDVVIRVELGHVSSIVAGPDVAHAGAAALREYYEVSC